MCDLYARLATCFKGIHSTKVVSEVWHGNLSLRKKLGRAIRGWLATIKECRESPSSSSSHLINSSGSIRTNTRGSQDEQVHATGGILDHRP